MQILAKFYAFGLDLLQARGRRFFYLAGRVLEDDPAPHIPRR